VPLPKGHTTFPHCITPSRCVARGAIRPYTGWLLGAAEPAEGVQGARVHIEFSQFRRAHRHCPRLPNATRVISPSDSMSRLEQAARWWWWSTANQENVSLLPNLRPHWPMSCAQVLINDACGPPGPHWDTACAPGVRGRTNLQPNQTKTQTNKTPTRTCDPIRAQARATPPNILNPDPLPNTHWHSIPIVHRRWAAAPLLQGPGGLLHGTRHVGHAGHPSGSTA